MILVLLSAFKGKSNGNYRHASGMAATASETEVTAWTGLLRHLTNLLEK
jgi:hypothetical protein